MLSPFHVMIYCLGDFIVIGLWNIVRKSNPDLSSIKLLNIIWRAYELPGHIRSSILDMNE